MNTPACLHWWNCSGIQTLSAHVQKDTWTSKGQTQTLLTHSITTCNSWDVFKWTSHRELLSYLEMIVIVQGQMLLSSATTAGIIPHHSFTEWQPKASKMLLALCCLYFHSRNGFLKVVFNSSTSCYGSVLCFSHTHSTPRAHTSRRWVKSPSKNSLGRTPACWAAASPILVLWVLCLPLLFRKSSNRPTGVQHV